jgi:hypothetical protein
MKKLIYKAVLVCLSLGFFSCASPTKALLESDSQVKLRSIQSRRFETNDKNKALRTAMATLQDLGFVIDEADETLGSVSATKLNTYQLRMTVTVRPFSETEIVVRANAQYNLKAIEDPGPYQQFFEAYEKAMFLTAQNI